MKNKTFLKIAIFFVQMGIGTITPAIANTAAAFPDVPFTTLLLVSTLAVLVSVPATLLAGRLGGAPEAAMVLTMFTVGGMVAGLIFAKVFGFFKKNTLAVGLGLLAIAMASIGLGNTLVFMYIGTTVAGFGFSFILPTIFMDLGATVHPSQMATASGIIMASMNVGGFCSAYFFAFLAGIMGMTEVLKFPFYISMSVFAVAAVAFLFIKPKKADVLQPE
ncbi:MAG: hypothetical protein ACOH15_10245 [Acetobacterium sp.]